MRPLRAFLAVAVALALVPGTFWRSTVRPIDPGAAIVFTPAEIAPDSRRAGPLAITGVWDLSSASRALGGYSALVVRPGGSLLAGSDAGGLLTIDDPGEASMRAHFVDPAETAKRDKRDADLEALTVDPASGRIWAAYEGSNAIEALSSDLARMARAASPSMANWRSNSGPEAFARLADGRFVVLAEVARYGEPYNRGVLFPGDPAAAPEAGEDIRFAAPGDFRPVDMTQLPSGEVLVLLRRIAWGLPPRFENAIARLDPAQLAPGAVWRPQEVIAMPRGMPNDNFEGLAATAGPDGAPILWLVSDDNFSGFQRSLLVRMRWTDPRESARDPAREKAPGSSGRPLRNR